MEQREKDIQELCKQVLENCYPNYNTNNGTSSCPFCGGTGYKDEMSEIPHDENCAYLIAKDLSTGF